MNLRDWQKSARLTDTEVAARLGISRQYYSRIKTGRAWPRAKVMEAIVRAAPGVVLKDLLDTYYAHQYGV